MQDLPINLSGHSLMVTEAPSVKMRENEAGEQEPVTNRDGETQFVMNVFVKVITEAGVRARKGEEITVNLPVDPGTDIAEGAYVELVAPVINEYAIPDKKNPRLISNAGIWFKAQGVKLAARSMLLSA